MIPAELRALKGWLLWKSVRVSGEPKARKVPCYVDGAQRSGKQGSPRDRERWASYEDAARVLADDLAGVYEGLGFALSPDWGVVGLDFDECVDEAGNVAASVVDVIAGTYSEYSPSGTGVHAFLTGALTDRKSRAEGGAWGFEVFCEKGFLTMTGHETPACELVGWDTLDHVNGAVTELFEQRFGANAIRTPRDAEGADSGGPPPEGLDDAALRDLLKWHDPNAPYTSSSLKEGAWVKVGMALHHETSGDAARGLVLWDEHSAGGLKYPGLELLTQKWDSFGRPGSGAPVTARWLRMVAEARSNGLSIDISAFDVIVEPDAPAPRPAFARNRAGQILPTMDNAVMACARPDLCGMRIGHDDFRDEITIAAPGAGGGEWVPMTDADVVRLRIALERLGFKTVSKELVRDAVVLVAVQCRYDSAQLWLGRLVWDGVPRVCGFLETYLGCAPGAYVRAVSLYIWTALAGRVLVPGVKADMVPIFEGAQGLRKSSAIEAIAPAPEFFVEVDLADKEDDTVRKLRGALVAEIAELSGLHTRDLEGIKKFVVRKVEKWVPKYKEFPSTFKRRLIFIGTTNRVEILADDTGNRRWLPLHIERADAEGIARDHEQLWAEGAALFGGQLPTVHEGGVAWREAERLAEDEHVGYGMPDAWDARVRDWLDECDDLSSVTGPRGGAPFTTADVLAGAISLSTKEMNRTASNRVGAILRNFGYEQKTARQGRRVFRAWAEICDDETVG